MSDLEFLKKMERRLARYRDNLKTNNLSEAAAAVDAVREAFAQEIYQLRIPYDDLRL